MSDVIEKQKFEQARMIIESLPSLYNMQEFEVQAIRELIRDKEPHECEWKKDTITKYYTAHGEYENLVNVQAWNYCPYCGRKIKVTE